LSGIEIDEEKIALAKANYIEFNVENRAKIFQGDASEIIPVLTGEYDFIFLDGPKGHYFEYLPHLLSVLKVGGIIFADNVLFRGYVGDKVKTPHRFNTTKHSMENYLTAVTNSNDLQTEIIDVEDGVSITRKLK
jgi:predicted O-methyltransferase YrrM